MSITITVKIETPLDDDDLDVMGSFGMGVISGVNAINQRRHAPDEEEESMPEVTTQPQPGTVVN